MSDSVQFMLVIYCQITLQAGRTQV